MMDIGGLFSRSVQDLLRADQVCERGWVQGCAGGVVSHDHSSAPGLMTEGKSWPSKDGR